jgi:hypothetical protein
VWERPGQAAGSMLPGPFAQPKFSGAALRQRPRSWGQGWTGCKLPRRPGPGGMLVVFFSDFSDFWSTTANRTFWTVRIFGNFCNKFLAFLIFGGFRQSEWKMEGRMDGWMDAWMDREKKK